jgi:succinate dehydrogenase hydrophobic membrane anchor protein
MGLPLCAAGFMYRPIRYRSPDKILAEAKRGLQERGVIGLVGADYDTVQAWVGQPLPAILLVLLLIATFYHAALGLQVVIEDYIHGELARFGLVIAARLACIALAVAGIVAVLTLALGTAV